MAITDEFLTNAIGTCTAEVFSTMLGLELVQEPTVVEVQSSGSGEGVLALVGVAGAWSGTGVLQCEARLARKLCAALLMMEVGDEGVTEDVLDAVAEVANMIIGNVKNVLEPETGPMGMSVPTVIFGRNFTTRSAKTNRWLIVPFACGEEKFSVRFCLTKATEQQPVKHGYSLKEVIGL